MKSKSKRGHERDLGLADLDVPAVDNRAKVSADPPALAPALERFLERLLDANRAWIRAYGFSRALSRSPESPVDQALDLVTDVWCEAFKTLARHPDHWVLKRDQQSQNVWLRGIAKHVVSDKLERQYALKAHEVRLRSHADEDDSVSSEDLVAQAGERLWERVGMVEGDLAAMVDARDEAHVVWRNLNPRHQLAVYRAVPALVEESFPEDVERLKCMNSQVGWNANAEYKAMHDARERAGRVRVMLEPSVVCH